MSEAKAERQQRSLVEIMSTSSLLPVFIAFRWRDLDMAPVRIQLSKIFPECHVNLCEVPLALWPSQDLPVKFIFSVQLFLTSQCVIAPLCAWRAQKEVNISMKWQKCDVFSQMLFLCKFIALFHHKKIAENYLPSKLTIISIMCFANKRQGSQIYQKERNSRKKNNSPTVQQHIWESDSFL